MSRAASRTSMPGGVSTHVPLTYVSSMLKGPNEGVMSQPGCRDWVFGLTFSLPDCQLFFLDQ
jgi:hypothetical protein